MLTNTSEYALRALLDLAALDEEGPVPVDVLAERLDVPRNYLSKILHHLARAGVLRSTRGPHGGFQLARPAARTTLAQVVEVFEPEQVQGRRRCLLGRPRCSDADPCPVHDRWAEVSERMRDFFRTTTLAELRLPGRISATPGQAGSPDSS